MEIQQPNILGQYLAGKQAGQEAQKRNFLSQNGAAIMQGDQNALAQFAQLDPEGAMGLMAKQQEQAYRDQQMQMQRERMQMDREQFSAQQGRWNAQDARADEELQMRRDEARRAAAEHATKMDATEREAEAKQLENVLSQAAYHYERGDRAAYNSTLQQNGVDPEQYDFDNFPAHAAPIEGAIEALRDFEAASAGPEFTTVTGEEASARGLDPSKAYNVGRDGKVTSIGGGGVTINQAPQVGNIPQGYEMVRNPETEGWAMRPIPGGPEDTSEQEAARQDAAETSGDVVLNAAKRARDANNERFATGAFGQVASVNPSNNNAELYRQVDVLRSNATIEALNAMRAQSPTGGALGNVTEGEGKMLAAKAGALDPASQYFERDLADYTRTLLQTIHGRDAGDRIFDKEYNGASPQASNQGSRSSRGREPAVPEEGRAGSGRVIEMDDGAYTIERID